MSDSFATRFGEYFRRPVAERAAAPLAAGSEIEFHVEESDGRRLETFTFTRERELPNRVTPVAAREPQLVFRLTPAASEAILGDASEEIGKIGVAIAKLIASPDAQRRVRIEVRAGFLGLFAKGYFGVVQAGGAELAGFLAGRGLKSLDSFKSLLKRLKP